jgi:2-methylcitrate dehydratase PrpD
MGLARKLAGRITAMRYEDLPEEAIHWAKIGILDTVGVALAGSREDTMGMVERVTGAGAVSGPCVVFGSDRRASPLDAALINGTASHALDFDDCNNTMGGHPSAPMVPALIALGETLDASGEDIILAYVAGFETETKIALGVNFHHYEKGWHPTATLGTFGAAAACAKLLGLSVAETETALAIAVSLASGVKANFGTMTKPLHIGHCSRNGLFAALLAREGFTANGEAFEHKQGFLNVFNGPGTFDMQRTLDHWADPLDIVKPGLAIKQYPCCGSTHSAIDAMLEIVRQRNLTPGNVEKVATLTHKRRLEHTNRPDPRSPLEAKFSLQYCLARAVIDGNIVLEHFEGDAYLDGETRALMARIDARPHDESNHFGARITVTTKDGESYTQETPYALGRGPDNPLSGEMLRAKFENCARRALSADRVARLYGAFDDFENLRAIGELTAIIAAPVAAAQPAAE